MGHPREENLDQTVTLLHVREIRNYNEWVFSLLAPHLGRSVLEIGCGIGTYSRRARERVARLVCVDVQPAYARTVARQFTGDRGVAVVLGELGGGLAFRRGSFDTIVCLNVIEHIEDDGDAVAAMAGWLRPGGTLLVQVPAHRWLLGSIDDALGHYRRYSPNDLAGLLEAEGLEVVVRPRRLFAAAVPGWWWHGRVRRARRVPEGSVRAVNALAAVSRAVEAAVPAPLGITLVAAARRRGGAP